MGGISASTANNLVIAPGAYVAVGAADLGALSETITYSVEIETYHPDLYGAKGNLKGTGHDVRAIPSLTFTMTELEYSKLSAIYGRLGASSDANSEWIGGGAIGKIADANYPKWEVLGITRHDGKAVHVTIDQGFVRSALNVALSDREDTFIEVEVEGVYTCAAPTTFPAKLAIAK